MKRFIILMIAILMLCGCSNIKFANTKQGVDISVSQLNSYKEQITKLVSKKSWALDSNITFSTITLPQIIQNTYYSDILNKSKDIGLDFSKSLNKEVTEIIANIKYENKDVIGKGHFIFYQDKLIGAYYTVGNYIYSLNEKEVFKKDVKWDNIENTNKKLTYKEETFNAIPNIIYWTNYNNNSYIYSYDNSKLKEQVINKNQIITNREIKIDGLFLISMFIKDVDRDKKSEMGILVKDDATNKSKLLIYEYSEKLKQKYSIDFENQMLSADCDGKDIIVTDNKGIYLYTLEEAAFKKNYSYSKIGGVIKVDDIDNSGVLRYILVDSTGTDIYVFERSKNELEEIWRSYNNSPQYSMNIQTADLNQDKVKEIYLKDKSGSTRKIILGKTGFIESKDMKKDHTYVVTGMGTNGGYQYFDISKVKNKLNIIYKY